MEKILVIGGTGNIGYPVIQYLLKQSNCSIVAGIHDLTTVDVRLKEDSRIDCRRFDFLDTTTHNTALEDVDKVFFIRPPQLAEPKKDMMPFLNAVKQHNIKHLVFVSLLGVEKNPMTPHHKIEKMISQLAIPYTFIRPSFFMQNLNTTHQYDIVNHNDLFIPAGNAKTSFIDTRDIGEIAGICLCNQKYIDQKLDITGAEALTYDEIAELMSIELNRPITYSKPGLFQFRKTMIARGIPKEYANVMTMLYLITQLGNAKLVTSTAREVLGRPPISFQQYCHDYRNCFLPQETSRVIKN